MAGMDLSGRRADRGVSVFWMILAMGAGVFALLAILVVGAESPGTPIVQEGPEVVVTGGEAQVVGQGSTSATVDQGEASIITDTTTVAGPQEVGELPGETVDVEVTPGEPGLLEPVEPAAPAAATPGEGEVVVDPDGTTAPVVPTPSGPTGADGNPLTQD